MATTVLKQKFSRPVKQPVSVNRTKTIKTPTTDAVTILERRFGNPESEVYMVEELERILLGNRIYDLRTKAGMTRSALAKKIGMKAADISRLEEADYEGHALQTLRKIAAVFGMRLELNFVPLTGRKTGKN